MPSFATEGVASEQARAEYTNPILAGGYPDPSICRDGDDFYLVNSSFEYFPGLPIHHSKDLINWQLIGYGLDRKEQVSGAVNLVDIQSDGGIHAPTIRCHNGQFFIITTNVYYHEDTQTTDFVNFVITADNPAGPWSDPHVLEGAPGIDPDIFFDDDGKVWYVGTHSPKDPNFDGEGEIWLQEIDTQAWKLTGERHYLWRGACGGVWVEGPHIYKHDGRYYLMVAEGGTGFNHAVMIATANNITGPYVSNPRNPILTTRHLSYSHWVHSTGHGDLVELADGRWYMVLLGKRGDIGTESNMGRETHLVPVIWEREPFWWKEDKILWPVVAPQSGKVDRHLPVPFVGSTQQQQQSFIDEFNTRQLDLRWNFRRLPLANALSLDANPGFLRMHSSPKVIQERGRANLLGFRQTQSDFEYTAKFKINLSEANTEAGIILFQKDNNFLKMTLSGDEDNTLSLIHSAVSNESAVVDRVDTLAQTSLQQPINTITMKVISRDQSYQFLFALNDSDTFQPLVTTPADGIISRKYTGAYLGLYISSNGQLSEDFIDVDWVKYRVRP